MRKARKLRALFLSTFGDEFNNLEGHIQRRYEAVHWHEFSIPVMIMLTSKVVGRNQTTGCQSWAVRAATHGNGFRFDIEAL